MEKRYSVVVMLNNEVWGTWTLEKKPDHLQEIELRRLIAATVEESEDIDDDSEYWVEFSSNVECDSFNEVLDGIKESIENDCH